MSKYDERRYIFSGVYVKYKRALFYEKCLWCNGKGITEKEIVKAEKEGRLPLACSCVVLVDMPIDFIVLPFQIGKGVILKKELL